MTEKKFAQGFIFKRPRENAPDFVKGSLSIKVSEAIKFLNQEKDTDWVNLDLLVSKDGSKLYFTLNNWKPEKKEEVADLNPSDSPF